MGNYPIEQDSTRRAFYFSPITTVSHGTVTMDTNRLTWRVFPLMRRYVFKALRGVCSQFINISTLLVKSHMFSSNSISSG